ncbi:unnamed protein product [Knipowitschia caucasica]
MVDARYKDRYFDPDKKKEARNMLLKVVDEMASVGNDQQEDAAGASVDDPSQEDRDPPPKRARTGSLQDMYQEILTENDEQATTGNYRRNSITGSCIPGRSHHPQDSIPFQVLELHPDPLPCTCPSCTQVPHCALYQGRQRAAV